MTPSDAALVRRRARNLLLFALLAALTVGTAATQFVAWRLNYHAVLGPPLVAHAYLPWKVIEWWQAPWEPQVDATFQYLKFGLILTVCLGGMMALKARQTQPKAQPDIHGTARFADEKEIRLGSLFPRGKPGVIVGGWRDRKRALHYLTDAGEGHVLSLGPTRCGKSYGVLIPTLLTWPESAVVVDPKGELWQQTAGWRHEDAGNTVMRFAPGEVENTVAWNPFDRVRRDAYIYRDTANIIEQVADPQGKGLSDHWEPTAAHYMLGVALFLTVTGRPCSLSAILSAIDSSADPEVLLKAMANCSTQQVAEAGRGMLATASRERASIISTARRLLRIYRDPVLAKNTSSSSFRIDDLVNASRPVTLYIETRGEDELRLRPLVRLFLTVALGQLISGTTSHRWPLLVAIDEVASLRKMEPLEMFLSKSAGAGIRFLLLAQDYQQLVNEYGEQETITSNCGVLTAHAPNNQRSTEWLSRRTGQGTVVVEDVSESQAKGGQRSQNRTFRSVPRPVLTPDEVGRLKLPTRDANDRIIAPGELLIFQAGQHVIRGTQSLAFLDPEFRWRSAIPAPPTMRSIPS